MATDLYENIVDESNEELARFAREATRLRGQDVEDFTNLSNVFMRGRKVGKIPTGSSDITDSRVGDFNYDTSYFYICVDNAGTATWRRVSIGAW